MNVKKELDMIMPIPYQDEDMECVRTLLKEHINKVFERNLEKVN